MNKRRFVIITGLSGSGKTFAANSLEDLGYFCVDNLPTQLLPTFKALITQTGSQLTRAALVMDMREKYFPDSFQKAYREHLAGEPGIEMNLIFLEASDSKLLARFSESRRPHPFEKESGIDLKTAIVEERRSLSKIRDMADIIIDTSEKNVHELKSFIKKRFGEDVEPGKMHINIMSFGFRHGIPDDANIVLDVRFLPNPFYIDDLRKLDGENTEVRHFVKSKQEFKEFLNKSSDLLHYLIPKYESEGKAYLTIAAGCTAGRHRSVVVASELAKVLQMHNPAIKVIHRDKGKE